MKFNSKTEATSFLAEANISFEIKATLIDIVDEHALEGTALEIVGDENDVLCVIFEADHDVKLEKEIESHVICAHSVKGVCVATVVNNTVQQTAQEIIMENNQDAINARIAAEMEAFKAEQRAKFDEAVRVAAEQMLAAQAPAAAPEPVAAEPSRLARLASKVNVQKVKKVAIYAAGVAAVGVGGYFAWKKFCGNDIVAAVAPVASEQL